MGDDTKPAADAVATFGVRALARVIDGGLAWLVGAVAAAALGSGSSGTSEPALTLVAAVAVSGAVGLAYDVIGQAIGGATIGKAICGLRVRSASMQRCSFGAALVRNLVVVIDEALFPLTFFRMRASPLAQRWGDSLAGTVVVHAKHLPPEERSGVRLPIGLALSLAVTFVQPALGLILRHAQTPAATTDTALAEAASRHEKLDLQARSSTSGRCAGIADEMKQSLCFDDVVNEAEHPEAVCDAYVGDVRGRCAQRVALATKNAEVCAGVPVMSARDDCFQFAAGALRKPSVCSRITSPVGRDRCLTLGEFAGVPCGDADPRFVCARDAGPDAGPDASGRASKSRR